MSFYPTRADERTKDALRAVMKERVRQEALWGIQHHSFDVPDEYDIDDDTEVIAKQFVQEQVNAGTLTWWAILAEEGMEAIVAAKNGDLEQARQELVELAAVACAMVEDIDSRKEDVA